NYLGDTFTGTGRYFRTALRGSNIPEDQKGTFDGRMTSSATFSFYAAWDSGSVGKYSGVIDDAGRISGTTHDNNSEDIVSWQGTRRAKCVVAAAKECPSGQVWRDTFDGDSVCVRPDERHRLAN